LSHKSSPRKTATSSGTKAYFFFDFIVGAKAPIPRRRFMKWLGFVDILGKATFTQAAAGLPLIGLAFC
jgi:hypothetical protein